MDRTKPRSGIVNVGLQHAAEHDGDLFKNSSREASRDGEESFVNEYAAASQARETGRSPRPIEGPQSARHNAQSVPCWRKEVSTTEHSASEIQDQRADADIEPVEATPSPPDDHGKQKAPVVSPRLMTDQRVATYLGFSVRKVWRLRHKDPDFPQPIKIGGSSRWDPVEIDCYIDVCKARRPNGR